MERTATVGVLLLAVHAVLASAALTVVPADHCSAEIDQSSENCMTIDVAFEQLMTGQLGSNTTMELLKGTHVVENVNFIQNLANIQILGLSDASDVIVTCKEGIGLVFINVSGLTLSNMTIQHCGLNDTDSLFSTSFSFIDSFFQPPLMFSVGVSLMSCANVVMQDVNFERNIGFGMLAINVVGNSRFTRAHFNSNFPATCVINPADLLQPGGAGGAAFFLFTDYKRDYKLPAMFGNISNSELVIEHSNFSNNYACRIDLFALLFSQLPRSISPLQQQVFNITRAGGLTVALAQGRYRMNAEVDSCIFRNNTSTYNGAAMEAVQFENTDNCHIVVKNSMFLHNGGGLVERYGQMALDPVGALVVAMYLRVPQDRITTEDAAGYIRHLPSSFSAINCTFIGNVADTGGAVLIFSFGPAIGFVQDEVYIRNSTFKNNRAVYGPVMYITELSYSGFEPGIVVYVENVTVTSNLRLRSAQGLATTETGILDINYLNVFFNGTNMFYKNFDTVVSAYSSILSFQGTSNFTRNSGRLGGGMHFDEESYMILEKGSKVLLVENEAQDGGGGVYADFKLNRIESRYDCFVYFGNVISPFCGSLGNCELGGPTTSLEFINNRAPYGSAIYGSTLSNCPWGEGLPTSFSLVSGTTVNRTITFLNNLTAVRFSPSVKQGENIINTAALVILPKDNSTNKLRDGVMPGQEFILDLGAFDQLLQPVPITIFSLQVSPSSPANVTGGEHASIGETDRYLLTGGSPFTSVPITIFASEDLSLNVTISTDDANVQFTFHIHLSKCQIGFRFDEARLICECLVNETLSEVECHPDGSINYPADAWIGQDEHGNFILHDCIADFCEPMVTDLNLSEPDMQCNNHRSGILCGECQRGYSRVLGSSACKRCPNNGYLALVVVFAILGLVLVVAISRFKITITDGYLNGFIFYGNLISILAAEFLPGNTTSVLIVTSFLNLDLGIETCFYDGMTPMAAVGLELVFPFYLAGILLVITVFSRFWSRFKFFKDFNAAQVFATLLLLSYSSIIFTCTEILGFVAIDSPSGNLVRWRGDPNVEYFRGLHLFLSLVSILLLLILVPLPIPLLFPSLIFKVKRLVRLKPLIDAFVAPFKPKRRFWLGFRLVFRLALLLAIYFGIVVKVQLLIFTIFVVLLIMVQSYLAPFNTESRNIVDLSVLLNLTLLSIVALYLEPDDLTLDDDIRFVTIGFTAVVSFQFVLLILYYILKAIPVTRQWMVKSKADLLEKWTSLKNRHQTVKLTLANSKDALPHKHAKHTTTTVALVSPDPEDFENFETTDFIRFRESLLN